MHDIEVAQYGAWLKASFTKIQWKIQGSKSHFGSSSYDKQNVIDEEILPIDLEQVKFGTA